MNIAIKNYSKHKSVLFHFYVTISAKFQLAAYLLKIRFTTCQIRVIHLPLQNILSSTNWNLWWIVCVQLRRG